MTSGAAVALLVVASCVLGFRGKAAFRGEHDLTGIQEVRITLPDTPIDVVACTPVPEADDEETGEDPLCPEALAYRGIWDSIAGTAQDAEDNAAEPTLQLVRERGFAALSAIIPLSVSGLVDLDLETITLPGDRDLRVNGGVGDIAIEGVSATVTVVAEFGDVQVIGGDEGVAVNTGEGDITVVTAGHADLRTEFGRVQVEQQVGARDLTVVTGDGDIRVTLASDADVELTIEAPGTIEVRTPQVTAVTDGSFARRLGAGSVRITLTTDRGGVVVQGP